MIKLVLNYFLIDKCLNLLFGNIDKNFKNIDYKFPVYGLTAKEAIHLIKNDPRLVVTWGDKKRWFFYSAFRKPNWLSLIKNYSHYTYDVKISESHKDD